MRPFVLALPLVCTLAAPALLAQTSSVLPRGETKVNTNYLPVNRDSWTHWQVATPKQRLKTGAPGSGLSATAKVAYLTYLDESGSGESQLAFRRSVDGGITWGSPQVVYQLNSTGGEFIAGGTEMQAWENRIYVIFLTNAHDLTSNGQSLWMVGSADQGQTWTAPMLLSTQSRIGATDQFFDIDAPVLTVDSGVAHVVFEADYFANPSGTGTAGAGSEDLFYTQIDIQSGALTATVPQTRIDHGHAAGSVDIDNPDVAAEGPVVHIVWLDDRNQVPDSSGVLTHQNDTFSRTSLNSGTDFATVPEVNHTNFTFLLRDFWANPRPSRAGVDLPHVYTFMEDSRDQVADTLYMDWSQDVGQTIAHSAVPMDLPQKPFGADADGFRVHVDGGRITVFTKDDRAGGNASNQAFVYVDDQSGADFAAGNQSMAAASPANQPVLYELAVADEVVAVVYEICSFPEDFGLGVSVDGGATFTHQQVSTLGTCGSNIADVDDVYVDVTLNRDVVISWVDDRDMHVGGNNDFNNCYVTGLTFPTLIDNTLVTTPGSMKMVDCSPGDVGKFAFLMISASGTAPTVLDDDGFCPNLTRDFFFNVLFANPQVVLTTVQPNLEADFTGPPGIGVPNLTALFGFPVWVAGGTADTTTLELEYFTDTLQF